MGRRHLKLAPLLGLFCSAQLSTQLARAEDPSAAETAAARSLAVDGLKLAQAGNCAEAVPKLERAEKLYHAPVVASRLGECYVSMGKLVEGTEVLRRVLREPVPADPPPALLKALERAQKALDSAKPRIAGITLKVATVSELSVKIDGDAVPSALLETEIPSDPGEHQIEAIAPGFLKSSTRVTVTEGEKKTITLTLTRDPNAPIAVAPNVAASSTTGDEPAAKQAPARSDAPLSTEAGEPEPPRSPNRTAAYVSLGIGAAALGAGGVLGFMTIQKHKDLKDSCPDNMCTSDKESELDDAKQLGNFSNIAFGVGAAGIIVGTVLYFTAGPSSSDRAHVGKPARRYAGLYNPRAAIGPTQIQLGADF
jgi:hypothetical protein